MSKDKLKPCPFCGSEAKLTKHGSIWCENAEGCCNVMMLYPAPANWRTSRRIKAEIKKRSIKAWNRRAK